MKNVFPLFPLALLACASERSEAPATRPAPEVPVTMLTPPMRDVPAVAGVRVPPVSHRTALRLRFDGPATQLVRVGDRVDLYRITLQAERDLEARLPPFLLEALVTNERIGCLVNNESRANFTNLRVDDLHTGALLAGPASLRLTAGSPRQSIRLPSDTFQMRAGEERTLAFRATTVDQDETGCPFANQRFVVTAGSDGHFFRPGDVRILDEDRPATDAEIEANVEVTGNPITIIRPELHIGLGTTVASSTGVKNQPNVPAVAITLAANGASDIQVRRLPPVGVGDVGWGWRRLNFPDVVLTCALYDGQAQVGTAQRPNSEGQLSYEGLSYIIPRATTRTLIARCRHDSVVAQSTGDRYGIGFAGPEGIDAIDADNRRVRVTVDGAITGQLTAPTVEVTVRNAGRLVITPQPSDGGTATGGDLWHVAAAYDLALLHEEGQVARLGLEWDTSERSDCLSELAIAYNRVIRARVAVPADASRAEIHFGATPLPIVAAPGRLQVLARFNPPRAGTRCTSGTRYAIGLSRGFTGAPWDATYAGQANLTTIGSMSGEYVFTADELPRGLPITVIER